MEDREEFGPKTEFAKSLHAEKYRGKGEDFRTAMSRIANALSDNEEHYREFREILLDQRFLPGGRIQAAAGSTKNVTPYNCFVSGTIEDSFVDGNGCIMDRAAEAAATMRMGGGIGYDFSTLRPSGDPIRKLQSYSSGPVSFMGIFDAVCKCIASSGHRRGAQMGVLRIDHPDIEEFIHAKQNSANLTGFNISVGVTDEFMECLEKNKPFALKYEGKVYRYVDPQALWDALMRSTWDWAEPGVLFIDRINDMNNLQYCETIAATNPCGN
jgi:ribonucleoside-diphosphate reductase alpha chain